MNKTIVFCAVIGVLFLAGCFFVLPYYNVWQQEMSGKAEFAKAEQNRKIKIEEAKRLAWEKFKKNLPKKCFEILADKK